MEEPLQQWLGMAMSFSKEMADAAVHLDGRRIYSLLAAGTTDFYLLAAIGLLTVLAFVQMKVFSRPPPLPLKSLPRRPALSVLFKPDDPTASTEATSTTVPSREATTMSMADNQSFLKSGSRIAESSAAGSSGGGDEFEDAFIDTGSVHSFKSNVSTEASTVEAPLLFSHDLPDSFAPLLSSSHTEVVLQQLTADLLHAVQAEASVRLREGRHEIPLNKDLSRPQFQLLAPKGGCRISAVAVVGSDNLSLEEDLDVTRETNTRSKPMVKKAELVLDPPMPLANVAPTLIHIPTLFEDKKLPSLRRIQIVRTMIDFVISISSWLEKLLWIVESFCQIHLSNVQITPVFKGRGMNNAPDWRLSLAFSGHVLLFGFIPIPFISVVLPAFIIPQPHALISNLMSKQPLASAKIKRENIAEKKISLAVANIAESWNVDVKLVATPPALCLDVTLPGGGKLYQRFNDWRLTSTSLAQLRSIPQLEWRWKLCTAVIPTLDGAALTQRL